MCPLEYPGLMGLSDRDYMRWPHRPPRPTGTLDNSTSSTKHLPVRDPGRQFPSFERAEHKALHWIGFYKQERLHEALGDVPPADYEEEHHRLNYKRDNNRILSAT